MTADEIMPFVSKAMHHIVTEDMKPLLDKCKDDVDLKRELRVLLVKRLCETEITREQLAFLTAPLFIDTFEKAANLTLEKVKHDIGKPIPNRNS